MAEKRGRKAKTSSGNRRNHEGENRLRREAVHVNAAISDFVRKQANRRWPTKEQVETYFKMNTDKRANRGRAGGRARIAPREVTFPLLHEINAKVLNTILVAASLKIKKVRRDPGFVLTRTYNLKNRPVVFI